MTPFLTTLLAISLSMALLIALLLLLGPLLARWYRPHWRYWAWLAVAVRLLIPLHASGVQAPIQLQTPHEDVVLLARPTPQVTTRPPAQSSATPAASASLPTSPAPQADQAGGAASGGPLPQQQESPAVQTRTDPVLTLGGTLTALWALGAVGMLLWHLLGLVRFARYVRRWAVPLSRPEDLAVLEELRADLGLRRPVPVCLCPGVESPMLAGLFRPVILLPQQPPQGEMLWFALRHELLHYRRRDIPYKAVLLLANCVHWFNPLVWVMRAAADRDMELCCDAGVIAGLSQQQRSSYGQAILSVLGRAASPVSPASSTQTEKK